MLHGLLSNPQLRTLSRRFLPASLVERAKGVRSRNLKKSGLSPEERGQAIEMFRDDIRRTQDLIGRDLSHWLAA